MYGQTRNNDVILTGGVNPLLAGRYLVVRLPGTDWTRVFNGGLQ